MIDYDNLPQNVKSDLEYAVADDPYGLSPKTLYKNIAGSLILGTPSDKLSIIYEVPKYLIISIEKVLN